MSSAHGCGDAVLEQRIGPHVLLVTLNRPEKRNALDVRMSHALGDMVRRSERDETIRAVVLTGAGDKCFCAGADLADIAAGRGADIAVGNAGLGGLVFAERSKPWIAAVRGLALGGGMELALACDMIVAADDAAFGLPEVKRGLIAAAGGVFRIARCLPRSLALELLSTGEPISASAAHSHGMVNRLVPGDEAVACAIGLAEKIASNSPAAVRESLAIARIANEQGETELRALMDLACERVVTSEDAMEGMKAFLEGRAPCWSS